MNLGRQLLTKEVLAVSDNKVLDLMDELEEWKDLVQMLHDRDFFMKWKGSWPTFNRKKSELMPSKREVQLKDISHMGWVNKVLSV